MLPGRLSLSEESSSIPHLLASCCSPHSQDSHSARGSCDRRWSSCLQSGPAGISVNPASSHWGPLPGAVLIGLLSPGDLAMGSSQILTLQWLPLCTGGAGFLFPSSASSFRAKAFLNLLLDISVVIMYGGLGWPTWGACPVVCLGSPTVRHSDLFKGTCTEIGNVPHFLSHPLPGLLAHLSCSVFSGLLCFVSPGSPPFILFPSNP